jgi:hypothetical protein
MFLLVGDAAERLRVQALWQALSLTNIVMLAQERKERVPPSRLENAHLILLRKAAVFRPIVPSKIFEADGGGPPDRAWGTR